MRRIPPIDPRYLAGGIVLVAAGAAVPLVAHHWWKAPAAAQVALKPVTSHADATGKPTAPPIPKPIPIPHWSQAGLRQLLHAIDGSAREGLHPADYKRDALAAAISSGEGGEATDALAWGAARALAHDYADGRISKRARFDWHVEHSPAALATLDADLSRAVEKDGVDDYLAYLLPTDARYGALRQALADAPADESARIDHIRASMERWRWMPRALGDSYVMVNVPAYRLSVFEGTEAVATHDVVVGAPKTPTPMLSARIGSIIVNPWWTLPPTVLREGKRYPPSKGYVYQTIGGKAYVRQKPGPSNALGRVKIDMPNAYAIYLHDTPSKWGFAKANRALSHGCIRVKGIADLAAQLDDTGKVAPALEGDTTRYVQQARKLPVYIVYFTAASDADGKVVTYGDPYDRDPQLIAALDGKPLPKREAVKANPNTTGP